MNKITHTPGPWICSNIPTKYGVQHIVADGPRGIATIFTEHEDKRIRPEEDLANIALIASAPDLLRELKEAVRIIKARDKEHGELSTDIKIFEQVIAKAEAIS